MYEEGKPCISTKIDILNINVITICNCNEIVFFKCDVFYKVRFLKMIGCMHILATSFSILTLLL